MNKHLIPVNEFCEKYNIETSFLYLLKDTGLIELTITNESEYITEEQLQDIERIVRLYYELDINIEGIETITYLLERIRTLQEDITRLRNRLRVYEDEF